MLAGLVMAVVLMLVQSKMHVDVLYDQQRIEYEELSRNATDAIDSLLQECKRGFFGGSVKSPRR